ncbi:MAG: hypothetical protein D6772_12090 [Bacteroidetes bacterium]|nr:MAG: hypothetical protein D6772_12090 [Bacteroidota bacterium]
MSAQSSQGARTRQAGRLSEAFQRSEEDKEQAKSEERSDDQRKLKITNLALEDYNYFDRSQIVLQDVMKISSSSD